MDTFMNIIFWWSFAGFAALTVLYFAAPSLLNKVFDTDEEE